MDVPRGGGVLKNDMLSWGSDVAPTFYNKL